MLCENIKSRFIRTVPCLFQRPIKYNSRVESSAEVSILGVYRAGEELTRHMRVSLSPLEI